MGIVWTILVGFAIGVVAKLLHPGKENMGFLATILLGVAGSFLAGIIGQTMGWYQAGQGAGFIASVVAAIILLVVYGRFRDKGIQ
ncbi:GlsB/YeaQ/YmgE family stress response membrane protein [uncultured Dechloromonas sp.]|uniref:GlsB/YeaQ/YmgE family stress response membrane protein n=1 Tax=uncultured Dechloromonas sp. TaxID=171719 RepID=UPI0025F43D65|nr:GlsB/YeaQ/YmgE family stress response membrane protein [uncultured Dechloromonas sp.]